jgi:Domain of unknown function (DUF4263)
MPTHSTWRRAVRELRKSTGRTTTQQRRLATLAGIRLPKGLPKIVAAARLKAALATELCLSPVLPSSEGQLEYLATLNAKRAQNSRVKADHHEFGGWLEYHLLKRRQDALERLRLETGDVVEVRDSAGNRLREVVSVTSDGRVLFKGGQGAGAWPDTLNVRCRKGTNTKRAQTLRKTAANQAAERSKAMGLSNAKGLELDEFRVTDSLTLDDVEQLQEVIDAARSESPIQNFLEAHPRILAALLTGFFRFSVARPRFGIEHIPDFLLGDVDSLGVHWILVELETPVSDVTLKNDRLLEKHARKGVSQVEEWREWIQNNLDKARRSRREGGLGLFDIRPRSKGLVLVGRRPRLNENAAMVRNAISEGNNIQVHTYDWLTQTLRGVLGFKGPSGSNPYLLQPLQDEEDG